MVAILNMSSNNQLYKAVTEIISRLVEIHKHIHVNANIPLFLNIIY